MNRRLTTALIVLALALTSLSSFSAPALADTGDDIVIMTPEPGLSAALVAEWDNHTLTIYVGYPLPGCLRLIGAGRPDAPLPGSCGVATYTLSQPYSDQDYNPNGRVAVLQTYDGMDRAFYRLPADPGLKYLPLIVGP